MHELLKTVLNDYYGLLGMTLTTPTEVQEVLLFNLPIIIAVTWFLYKIYKHMKKIFIRKKVK